MPRALREQKSPVRKHRTGHRYGSNDSTPEHGARSRTSLRHPPPRLQGTSIRTGRRPQKPSMTRGHQRRPSSLCAQPNTFFSCRGQTGKSQALVQKITYIPIQEENSFSFDSYHAKIKVFFQGKSDILNPGCPVHHQRVEKKRTKQRFNLSRRTETREEGGLTLAKRALPALYVARLPIVGAASPSKEKTHE